MGHPAGRNLVMDLGEQAHRVKFMIRDADQTSPPRSTPSSRRRDPDRSLQHPDARMNAIAERRIGGCRRELLDRTLIWNLQTAPTVLREYAVTAVVV